MEQMSEQNDPVPKMKWRFARLLHIQDFVEIILVVGGIGGAIWTTAVWTNNWDRANADMKQRVDRMEHIFEDFGKLDLPKKMNLLEYRIDQNDQRRVEDASSRRQFETDVGGRLDKIIATVTQIQIRVGDGPGPVRTR
jgi:hypothetical protein